MAMSAPGARTTVWTRARRAAAAATLLFTAAVLSACQPQLSGVQFKQLYDRLEPRPGSVRITSPPPITGDPGADARIRSIAEWRGYRLRSQHAGFLGSVAGVPIDIDVVGPFQEMAAAARARGFWLGAGYGYRSVDHQRSIFMSRVPYSPAAIRAGRADRAIDAALMWVAAPGYSKHHSGFTLDLRASGSGGAAFATTGLAHWLAADNYAVAKSYGFIPSYPSGAGAQGPEPEPWEYVYVGPTAVDCALVLVQWNDPAGFDGCSQIRSQYRFFGGAAGPLGAEAQIEGPMGDGRGRREIYRNGVIAWSPRTGARFVVGTAFREYARTGYARGPLGYPLTFPARHPARPVVISTFEHGRIYWLQQTDRAVSVTRAVHALHLALGGHDGVLGFPTANPTGVGDGRGTVQTFDRGRIWLTPAGTARSVRGSILTQYLAAGGPTGGLGYPIAEAAPTGTAGAVVQRFERGTLTATSGG